MDFSPSAFLVRLFPLSTVYSARSRSGCEERLTAQTLKSTGRAALLFSADKNCEESLTKPFVTTPQVLAIYFKAST